MNTSHDQYFHDQIRRQTGLEAASMVLAECAETLGWDIAAFHVDKDAHCLPRRRDGEFIARGMGWPKDCLDGWIRRDLGRHCPAGIVSGRRSDPFAWFCEGDETEWFGSHMSPPQRQAMDHYGRYIAGGVTVPVRLNDRRIGYVSWCTRSRGSLRQGFRDTLSSVFLLSHTFIRHAESLWSPPGEPSAEALTAREVECLSWAARGKTEEEIGIILQRSRDTIHFHLRNAGLKLEAANRAHAIAIACTRGLISLN